MLRPRGCVDNGEVQSVHETVSMLFKNKTIMVCEESELVRPSWEVLRGIKTYVDIKKNTPGELQRITSVFTFSRSNKID